MNINFLALEAIRCSQITGARLAGVFEKMAVGTEAVGSPSGLLILSYIDSENMPKEGELVPTITLALKPFTTRLPKPEEPEDDRRGEKGEPGPPGIGGSSEMIGD